MIQKTFLLTVLLFFSYTQLFAQTGNRKPKFIVEPYLQNVTNNSFRVLWETSLPAKGAVKLGIAEFNVLKPRLNQLFKDEINTEYHDVLISGLKIDEFYFYQALTINEKGDTLEGPVTPIHIPDYSQMPVSFAVIGDTQNSPDIWGRLADLIYQERPSFLVHVGDLVQYGPHKNDWTEEFFKPAKNLLRFYPLYPALGNHEKNTDWFYRYFDLPSPGWFYTVKKGNVLFIFVDTNKDILPGSEQYHKLEHILASETGTWKIMVHHHPVYVSEEGFYGNTWFQRSVHGDPNEMHLKKLYETYGVDLVLNGHAHFYERTWPVKAEHVDLKDGVTYITTGGGNDEYSKFAANKSWYDARTRVTNHFLYISITEDNLYGMAIDSTGNVFDSWTIEKEKTKRLNAPYLGRSNPYFYESTTALIRNENQQGTIYYSLNGKDYEQGTGNELKIPVKTSTEISAYILNGDRKSRISTKKFEKLQLFPSVKNTGEGVHADYYEGNWIKLPDFQKENIIRSFDLDSINMDEIQPRTKDHFAVRFTGSFSVPETGIYRFLLESFDGSCLFIDGQKIINNDGIHYEIKREAVVALEKGGHQFEIGYFDFVRRETLNVWMGYQSGKMNNFNEFIDKN